MKESKQPARVWTSVDIFKFVHDGNDIGKPYNFVEAKAYDEQKQRADELEKQVEELKAEVERLRMDGDCAWKDQCLEQIDKLNDQADEIEKLRAELLSARESILMSEAVGHGTKEAILREALEKIDAALKGNI